MKTTVIECEIRKDKGFVKEYLEKIILVQNEKIDAKSAKVFANPFSFIKVFWLNLGTGVRSTLFTQYLL